MAGLKLVVENEGGGVAKVLEEDGTTDVESTTGGVFANPDAPSVDAEQGTVISDGKEWASNDSP